MENEQVMLSMRNEPAFETKPEPTSSFTDQNKTRQHHDESGNEDWHYLNWKLNEGNMWEKQIQKRNKFKQTQNESQN